MPARTARTILLTAPALLTLACGGATSDPFPDPIEAVEGVIDVGYEDFTSLPGVGGQPARPMLLVDEPGTGRMFANDMWGPCTSYPTTAQ